MRRLIVWTIAGAVLALIAAAVATVAALPETRHRVWALWNAPDRLPALRENSQVHYEAGGEDFAREVATLLPAANARVEAVHGRRFAHPVTVGVYVTPEAFAAANGRGSTVPVGTTFFGWVSLSPKLFETQRARLPAILTHELSHAHIQGWIGQSTYLSLPSWFKEGLSVMVSGGGGAELVGEGAARAAIERGEQIALDEAGSQQSVGEIRFAKAPAKTDPSWYPVVLAYRQAGMFVAYLRERDGAAFDRMMNAILDRRPFPEALAIGYHQDLRSLWQEFVTANAAGASPG